MNPCKHLDYEEGKYEGCKIMQLKNGVRYWERGAVWTDNGPGQRPNPRDVQFCKGRGRINLVNACYDPDGRMKHCYEEETCEEKKSESVQR